MGFLHGIWTPSHCVFGLPRSKTSPSQTMSIHSSLRFHWIMLCQHSGKIRRQDTDNNDFTSVVNYEMYFVVRWCLLLTYLRLQVWSICKTTSKLGKMFVSILKYILHVDSHKMIIWFYLTITFTCIVRGRGGEVQKGTGWVQIRYDTGNKGANISTTKSD